MESIGDENALSDDDESPTAGMGEDEKNLLINSHGEVHQCLVKGLGLQRIEISIDLLKVFAETLKAPEPPVDSDESMGEETTSQRLHRYRNSEQCEVSDPDECAVIHHGPDHDDRSEDEEGVQEF